MADLVFVVSLLLNEMVQDLQQQISNEKEQLQQDARRCAELRVQLEALHDRGTPVAKGPVTVGLGPLGHREGV